MLDDYLADVFVERRAAIAAVALSRKRVASWIKERPQERERVELVRHALARSLALLRSVDEGL